MTLEMVATVSVVLMCCILSSPILFLLIFPRKIGGDRNRELESEYEEELPEAKLPPALPPKLTGGAYRDDYEALAQLSEARCRKIKELEEERRRELEAIEAKGREATRRLKKEKRRYKYGDNPGEGW